MSQEKWKDIYFIDKNVIYDYRGFYQISNKGKIKSLDRKIVIKKYKRNTGIYTSNHYRKIKGKILKFKINKYGYETVYLYDANNKCKCHSVHRIVAQMFLQNPKNKICVNHIDGNKLNNCVENLEWCTYSENLKHAYKNGLKNSTYLQLEKLHKSNEKIIYQFDVNGFFIHKYNNKKELEEQGFNRNCVCRVCRKERKSYKNYIWKYVR